VILAAAEKNKSFVDTMEWIARSFEIIGVAVLALGFVGALAFVIIERLRGGPDTKGPTWAYATIRRAFARAILVALEILIAADLILTVTVERTLESVGFLGIIVLIRTFLSFSLVAEIEGVWPWQKARLEAETGQRIDDL